MTIQDLYNKRANLVNQMHEVLDRSTDGIMSAEDAATYERMENDFAEIEKSIARAQQMEARDALLAQPTSNPLTGKPAGREPGKTGRASDEYKADFTNMLRGKLSFNNTLVEGTGSAGGYLVPDEFERQIVMGLDEYNVIRGISKVIRTNGEHKIPVATTHSTAAWKGEGVSYVESDPAFTQLSLSAHKLTDLVTVSIELLQDSMFDIDTYVAQEFARAFAIAEEEAFCVGTGSGQPTGIFTANGGEVGVTTGKANEITADEIISLVYALKAPYRQKAKFVMSDTTVAAIRKLKDGNGVYMWQPALAAGEPDKLLGYDLMTSAYAPTIQAGATVAAFGDFQNYWIADRMGITVQRLNELYAGSGQVGFIATSRVDGKVILPEGIQLLKMHA